MLPVWLSHHNDIEHLQRAWQTEFEKRADGGSAALSGFHYQFLIALHDTLRAWLDRPAFERSRPSVLTECLSDILDQSSNDIVLVTQVKRTRRSDNLHDALSELWLIYDLALRASPRLVPYLRFRILSSKAELKDFDRALSQWNPEKPRSREADFEVFRKSVTAQLFSDPEDEILALLANDLRATDPTGYAQRWLGVLLEAASEEGNAGFRIAARSIWNDLQSIENSFLATRPSTYVWTSRDKPPENIIEGDVLTGERPQVHHLRRGYFASRPAVYQPIADRAGQWILDLNDHQDKQLRLPVFWIGGRSGSGKSVALMHVLALLSESGFGPVLWLGNKTELLRQAVLWALRLGPKNTQVIIGMDDPYAPNTQNDEIIWKEALAVLESVRQDGDASALPLVVCCGPSEQAERMQKDLPEEVKVNLRELPKEDREDILRLRSWYSERTKKSPPKVGDQNVLLVQLFFEWETGQSLPEFASRFRNRIKESDPTGTLEDFITRMLCVNRLYVGYPSKAVASYLTPDLQDTFGRLREEHHIAQDISDYGVGLWFAHPHLSNVIYESWYPLHSSRAVRSDHLRRVIKDSLEFGSSPSEKMAPLWAMSYATLESQEHGPRVGRLDQETIITLLPFVYASRIQDSSKGLTLTELPAWIQLRAVYPEAELTPDPVDQALSQIKAENVEERGLRLTCHKLFQHYDSFSTYQQSRVIESIIELLAQIPHWQGWAPVAEDAYRRNNDQRLVELILGWVNDHPRSNWAARLFSPLFAYSSADPQVLSLARELLPRVGGEPRWGDIAIRVMEDSGPEPPQGVFLWARNNYRQSGACYLLGRLLDKGFTSVLRLAFGWCKRWHTERSANYVLEPLLILVGPNEKVRDWCIRWIVADHRGTDTGFLVERLINTFPSDTEVLSTGLRWLENNGLEHGSWWYVWSALYGVKPQEILTLPHSQTESPYRAHTSTENQIPQGLATEGLNSRLAELRPDDPKVWYYFAIGAGRNERYEDEIAALKKATELDPHFIEAWQGLGITYDRLGQSELALSAAQKVIELQPDDPVAWYYLATKYIRPERYEDEIAALKKATELAPDFADAWKLLGATYNQVGQTELAQQANLKVTELKPDDPEGWYYSAISFGKSERYEDEAAALKKATELDPNLAEAWQALGATYNQLREAELALRATLKVTELKPDDPEGWYYLAVAYSKANRYEDEVAALIKATELDPHFIKAWQRLGIAYDRLGQTELAVSAAHKVIELQPDDPVAWYYLATKYIRPERYEDEIAALKKATELDPDFAEAWRALGATYAQLREPEMALRANMKVTELKPNDPGAWYYLAVSYLKLKDFNQAVTALTKATTLGPDMPIAQQRLSETLAILEALEKQYSEVVGLNTEESKEFYSIGRHYVEAGELAKATQAFQQAIQQSTDETNATSSLLESLFREATVAFHTEFYERAIILLEIITTIDRDISDVWNFLSSSYRRVGRDEDALDAAKHLSRLTPSRAEAWYKLGKRYAKLGQTNEAAEAFNQALRLNKKLKVARRELTKISSKH
jgi:tetratricopeptide (TPR) repeat protein